MPVIHPTCANQPVRRRRLATAVLAAALATPAGARAAHPLVSDDAGTLGRGAAQLELAAEVGRDRRRSPDGAEREDAGRTAAALTLGVTTDLDVVLGVASTWSRVRVNGAVVSSESGVVDFAVQAKWRVLELGGFSLAAKPGVTLGPGPGRASYSVALVASQVLGPVTLDLNGAYARSDLARAEARAGSRPDLWYGSLAIRARVLPSVQLVGDVGAGSSPLRSTATWSAFALGGVICAISERLTLDVGVKGALTAPDVDLLGLGGVAWRF
jgi:hypothetical protein